MGLFTQNTYNDLTASFLDGPNAWEAQRQNNGLLYITLPYNIQYPSPTGGGGNGQGGQAALATMLQFAVDSFPIPPSGNASIAHRYLNEERKYAGQPTFQNIQVTINDYLDSDTQGVCAAWRNAVYNPANGKIGWKRSYAASGHIDLFGPNGQLVRTHLLIGVWPQDFTPGQISMQGDATVMCSLTLSIDKVLYSQGFVKPGDVTSGAGGLGGNTGLAAAGVTNDGITGF
jgi:hypothetical protein